MPKVKLAPWIEQVYGSYGKNTKHRRAYDEALSEYLRSFKREARKAELAEKSGS